MPVGEPARSVGDHPPAARLDDPDHHAGGLPLDVDACHQHLADLAVGWQLCARRRGHDTRSARQQDRDRQQHPHRGEDRRDRGAVDTEFLV
jgi:hypothetical protein